MPARSKPRYPRFAQNLCAQRVRADWTQEKLAERLKISWRYYQSLEAGTHAPSFDLLMRIGKALGCSWNDLLQDTEK
jgi:transcriptional regulator with XRE-family HTH domain